jgi:hypothetical protein
MRDEVTYEEAMAWLDDKLNDADYGEPEIIEWIQDILWRYEDMRNS